MNHFKDLDFDKELLRGQKTYDRNVGQWWVHQNTNPSHQLAYKHVIRRLVNFYKNRKPPKIIVDYACGPGSLLWRLVKKFPNAKVIGIDGSAAMLEIADQALINKCPDELDRVELIESDLPNFQLKVKADLVVFCFPNICPDPYDQPYYDEHGAKHKGDRKLAKALAKAREKDPDDETCFDKPKAVFDDIMDTKVISRNLRGLLKKKGCCVRVEYSNSAHEELTKLVQMRCTFGMGALNRKFKGNKAEQIFKLLTSKYYISDVIEDVYHQTPDEDDGEPGGYHINYLKTL